MPEIARAIAIAIHSAFEKSGGNELGHPERTGPRPHHDFRIKVLGLNDLQRGDQLPAPVSRARTVISERGQGFEQIEVALNLSVSRFHAPNRCQDLGGYAVCVLEPVEQFCIRGDQLLASRHACIGDRAGKIIPDGTDEFRLVQIERFNAGVDANPGSRSIVGLLTNTCGNGLGAEVLQKGLKARGGISSARRIDTGLGRSISNRSHAGKSNRGNSSDAVTLLREKTCDRQKGLPPGCPAPAVPMKPAKCTTRYMKATMQKICTT